MHHVIEASGALEEIVKASEDAENTKREDPDTEDGDDRGLAANKPTEQGEERGDQIHSQNSTSQLPGGNWRPERTIGTSNEDQPILSQGDLKEEDLITSTKILHYTPILRANEHGGKCDPGADS